MGDAADAADAADDAIDRGIDEWLDEEWSAKNGYSGPSPRTCRYCRAGNLQWGLLAGRRRLFDADGELHRCSAKKVFGKAKR